MKLNLEKPLLFFDIESTGLNIATDAIIELSFVKVFPCPEDTDDNPVKTKTWKILPWNYTEHRQIPINPQASLVNGVHDEDLIGCPKFIEVISEVASWVRDSDLSGFNSAKFDLPMLAEEFERVKQYCELRIKDPKVAQANKDKAEAMLKDIDIDLHSCRMVDVQNIYHYMEPRNLKAAYRFYCGGKDFENAHTAEADTIATYEVLKAQLDMYKEPDKYHEQALKNDVEFLSGVGGRPKIVDYAGRIILKDGVPTVGFGKYRDKSVKEVFQRDPAYFSWIENGEFTLDTKRQFRLLKEQYALEQKQEKQQEKHEKMKPLEGEQLFSAAELLKSHFGSK